MSSMKAGQTLGTIGNYELLSELGRGNFGTVYRARHWESHQVVALKVIPQTLAKNPMLLKRFHQECLVAARLDHPNAVRVLEYSFNPAEPFLVMELVEGISMGEKLEREGKFTEPDAIRFIVQAAQGLEQVHHLGLLHRDIKPDNLLVTPEGIVKITDLGLAKDMDGGIELTRTGTGLGTPNFIAPEQFRNAKHADRRADVYGLGATLYQLVTGTLPFNDTNPIEILTRKLKNQLVPPEKIVPWLTDRTSTVIKRTLSIDPGQRYSSCWDFVEGLVDTKTGLGEEFERQMAALDYWYVFFTDHDGKTRRATGNTAAVVKAIRQGQIGDFDSLRLGRTMAGPFRPIERYGELLPALDQGHRTETPQAQAQPSTRRRTPVTGRALASRRGPTHWPEGGTSHQRERTASPTTPTKVPSATLQIQDLSPVRPPELPAEPTPAAKGPALYTASTAPKIGVAAARRPEPAATGSASNRTIFFLLLTGAATFLAGQFLLAFLR